MALRRAAPSARMVGSCPWKMRSMETPRLPSFFMTATVASSRDTSQIAGVLLPTRHPIIQPSDGQQVVDQLLQALRSGSNALDHVASVSGKGFCGFKKELREAHKWVQRGSQLVREQGHQAIAGFLGGLSAGRSVFEGLGQVDAGPAHVDDLEERLKETKIVSARFPVREGGPHDQHSFKGAAGSVAQAKKRLDACSAEDFPCGRRQLVRGKRDRFVFRSFRQQWPKQFRCQRLDGLSVCAPGQQRLGRKASGHPGTGLPGRIWAKKRGNRLAHGWGPERRREGSGRG